MCKAKLGGEGLAPNMIQYNSVLDCFVKTYRNEGLFGFYRGLAPQMIGVAPEKALKVWLFFFFCLCVLLVLRDVHLMCFFRSLLWLLFPSTLLAPP
jgi:hypothetical protein